MMKLSDIVRLFKVAAQADPKILENEVEIYFVQRDGGMRAGRITRVGQELWTERGCGDRVWMRVDEIESGD